MAEVSGYVMPDLVGLGHLVSFTLRDPVNAKTYKVEVWAADAERVTGFHEDFPPTPATMTELWAVVTGGQLYDDGTLVLHGDGHVAFSNGLKTPSHGLWLRSES